MNGRISVLMNPSMDVSSAFIPAENFIEPTHNKLSDAALINEIARVCEKGDPMLAARDTTEETVQPWDRCDGVLHYYTRHNLDIAKLAQQCNFRCQQPECDRDHLPAHDTYWRPQFQADFKWDEFFWCDYDCYYMEWNEAKDRDAGF